MVNNMTFLYRVSWENASNERKLEENAKKHDVGYLNIYKSVHTNAKRNLALKMKPLGLISSKIPGEFKSDIYFQSILYTYIYSNILHINTCRSAQRRTEEALCSMPSF